MHNSSTRDSQGPNYGVVTWVMEALATSVAVFLHYDFGKRYFGSQAALVLLIVPLFALFFPHDNVGPLFGFVVVYFCAVALHRGRRLTGRTKWAGHSYYNGRPRLADLQPTWNESFIKRIIEPIFVISVGYGISRVNVPLGSYVAVAGFCLFFMESLNATLLADRAMDLNDAVLEQQHLAERFRQTRGDF